MNFRFLLLNLFRYATSLLVLVIIWQGLISIFGIKPFLLPPPKDVFATLVTDRSLFFDATKFTLQNMVMGGLIGVILGYLTGSILAAHSFSRWLLEPYLVIFQSFPRESLMPLLVVWLGFGALSKVASAAMLCFFPTAVIALQALTDTRRDYLQLVESLGSNRWNEFIHCRLPSAVPSLLTALKVALPLALIGAVLGEFMGGSKGLGYLILTSGAAFRVDRVFCSVVILAFLGTLLLSMVVLLEKTLCRRYFQS